MRKRNRKLTLGRETLVNLEGLRSAEGGKTPQPQTDELTLCLGTCSCFPSCYVC
jgi:hypothetical protein